MARVSLQDPRFYLIRHLQWLAFNQRVLEEAHDSSNPLLEGVKFLASTANNLDEFVEIRVSGFLKRIEHGTRDVSPAMYVSVADQYRCWNDELLPLLSRHGIRVLSMDQLHAKAAKIAKSFYERLSHAHAGHC